jgi:hypothetical protein
MINTLKRLAIAVVAAAALAFVYSTLSMAWAGPGDWPAMSSNVIHLEDNKNNSNDGCRNYALKIINQLPLSNVMTSGENTTAATVTIQDHDYLVSVRCQVESKIIFVVVVGADMANSDKALTLFMSAWSPEPRPDKKEKRS